MKLTINQKNVIHWMVKYLLEEPNKDRHIKMDRTMVNINYTVEWFQRIANGEAHRYHSNMKAKRRLNLVRYYYLDKLKKDIK